MTVPQITRPAKLPDDHTVVVGERGESAVVEHIDSRLLGMQREGRVVATTLVASVQSYLDVDRC